MEALEGPGRTRGAPGCPPRMRAWVGFGGSFEAPCGNRFLSQGVIGEH